MIHKANRILKLTGPFWQAEYYDHLIRSNDEYHHYINYTLLNPVKGNLCSSWEQWPWTGLSEEVRLLMTD